MAQCDEGYLCQVCGQEVKRLIDSSLYLQYVVGWIPAESLHLHPEIHLRCNPSLSQFIEDASFEPIEAEGDFDRRNLDPEFVAARVSLISRGYARLRMLQRDRSLPIDAYPLRSSTTEPLT